MALAFLLESLVRAYAQITPTARGGYRLARAIRKLRPRDAWRDRFVTPDGVSLELELGVYPDCSMAFGLYEVETARLIKQLLQPGDHFVDAGANIGYFTMLAAQRVGISGRVDAFEPQAGNRERLLRNLEENRLTHVVNVHEQALSDRPGVAVFYVPIGYAANHGVASLFAPRVQTERVEVPTARMDAILAATSPTLIKMDVEGAEPLVVSGMSGLLAGSKPPAVIAEYNVVAAQNGRFAPREFIDRLLSLQPAYRIYIIDWPMRRLRSIDTQLKNRVVANLLFRVPDRGV